MKIESVHEKGIGIMNEDTLLIGKDIFGVFDGATSLNKYVDESGNTGGYLASSIARDTFSQDDAPLRELALQANTKIREAMLSIGLDTSDKCNLWCTNAAVVRFSEGYFEWLQIQDSDILVIYLDGSYKLLGTNFNHDKETLILWKKLADEKVEDIRSHLQDQIIKVRRTQNVSYGVMNGEEAMESWLNEGKELLENVAHIILFTDGLLIPKKDIEAPEDFDTFVKLYLEGGLQVVSKFVRDTKNSDPNCWAYPRVKMHDDMGGIGIEL